MIPKKQLQFLFFLLIVALFPTQSLAQIPTKTPPTPQPVMQTTENDIFHTRSNWHRARDRGYLSVGILYNNVPFGWLDIRGNVTGYDADILRSIASLWDMEVKFVHVTQQTGINMLRNEEVDLLAGGQSLFVGKLEELSFSHAYHLENVQIFVQSESPWQTVTDLIGQSIGVKQASLAEDFLIDWSLQSNFAFQFLPQATLDLSMESLSNGETEALVGFRSELMLLELEPGQVRPLENPLGSIPIAFAIPLTDSVLRDVLNFSLQRLAENNRMRELHAIYFPSIPYNQELIPQWGDLNEVESIILPEVNNFPEHFAVPKLRETSILRALLVDNHNTTMNNLSSNIAFALGELWNLTVEITLQNEELALDAIQNGAADIIVGIEPNWAIHNRVDFTYPYLKHGNVFITREIDNYDIVSDLPTPLSVIIPLEDQINNSLIRSLLEPFEIDLGDISVISSPLIVNELLVNSSVDAIFGNSSLLFPYFHNSLSNLNLLKNDADSVWFSKSFFSIGIPKNDFHLRTLVELGLQELARNNKIAEFINQTSNAIFLDTQTRVVNWPGSSESNYPWNLND